MNPARLTVLLVVVATVGACGTDGPATPSQPTIPTGVTWELECIGPVASDICAPIEEPGSYTIRFDDRGIVSGTNACNTCTGTYAYVSAVGLEIHWSCTEMACLDPAAWLGYGDAVASTTSFKIANGLLSLTSTDRGGRPLRLIHKRMDGGFRSGRAADQGAAAAGSRTKERSTGMKGRFERGPRR